MGAGAAVVLGVLLVLLLGLLVAFGSFVRELDAMAQALEDRVAGSNARLTVGFRSRATVRLARALNAVLDGEHEARLGELQAKAAFQEDLAALSHDIRTPLAGAQGYLELWQLTKDPVQRGLYFASAQERLAAVRALVDDLFEYTRAVAPCSEPLHAGSVCLMPLVEKALLDQYPAFAERGWEPRVSFEDEEFAVTCAPATLERICANLVTNTLRHGAEAPVIEQCGARLVFSNPVVDVSSIEVDRLFERFYRGNPARTGSGAGLGLAIVARLCSNEGVVPAASLEASTLRITLDFSSCSRQ